MTRVSIILLLLGFISQCSHDYFSEAEMAYEKGDYRDAINKYSIALSLDERTGTIWNNISACYIKLKIYDSAIYYIDKALELDPNSNKSYHNRGRYNQEIGNFHAAIDDLTKAISLDSNFIQSYYVLGLVYMEIDSLILAQKNFRKSLSGKYKIYDSQTQIANCYAIREKHKKAIDGYSAAINIDSTNPRGYRNRATSKSEIGQYESAINDLNIAFQLDSIDPENFRYRGRIHNHHGHYSKSIIDFQNLIDIEPNNSENYFELGMSKYRLKKYDEAIVDFQHAENIRTLGKYRYWIASTLYSIGKVTDAKSIYLSISKYDPFYDRSKKQIQKIDSILLTFEVYRL